MKSEKREIGAENETELAIRADRYANWKIPTFLSWTFGHIYVEIDRPILKKIVKI